MTVYFSKAKTETHPEESAYILVKQASGTYTVQWLDDNNKKQQPCFIKDFPADCNEHEKMILSAQKIKADNAFRRLEKKTPSFTKKAKAVVIQYILYWTGEVTRTAHLPIIQIDKVDPITGKHSLFSAFTV
jgi:hypothetical protein